MLTCYILSHILKLLTTLKGVKTIVFTLTITPLDNNKYYVYTLTNMNNQVLYIGADKIACIVSFQQLLGNPEFKVDGLYNINIYTAHKELYQASNEASRLVKLLSGDRIPPLNMSQHHHKTHSIICNETGMIYENAAEVCRALNVPSPRMSNHLRRKPGHKSIKGMTFKYV